MKRDDYRSVLEVLIRDLCVNWGFCSLADGTKNELLNANILTSVEFADMVVSGDGFVAKYETKWRRKISNKFIESFGSSLVIISDE